MFSKQNKTNKTFFFYLLDYDSAAKKKMPLYFSCVLFPRFPDGPSTHISTYAPFLGLFFPLRLFSTLYILNRRAVELAWVSYDFYSYKYGEMCRQLCYPPLVGVESCRVSTRDVSTCAGQLIEWVKLIPMDRDGRVRPDVERKLNRFIKSHTSLRRVCLLRGNRNKSPLFLKGTFSFRTKKYRNP